MGSSAFVCLRATHYRWLAHAGDVDALAAPELACVGDLHVENFGTWRDAEGRLVWGVNDFDESERLPYTYDLARLATSALLAIDDGQLKLAPQDACAAVLEGYRDALADRRTAVRARRRPRRARAARRRRAGSGSGALVAQAARRPAGPRSRAGGRDRRAAPRAAGERLVVRDAAARGRRGQPRAAPARAHRRSRRRAGRARAQAARAAGRRLARAARRPRACRCDAAVRAHDPFVHVAAGWAARRLAPDCIKLKLGEVPGRAGERRLLACMGSETANIHLASPDAIDAVRADLESRRGDWLHDAAAELARATRHDHEVWRDR